MREKPKRIQRKRTKGWRMPEGAKYVGRGSKWGNPFRVVKMPNDWGWAVKCSADDLQGSILVNNCHVDYMSKRDCAADAVKCFRRYIKARPLQELDKLRGHDLSCWCREDEICHADVVLELANQGAPRRVD